MKVLVVGSGGREHVLAWKLAQSKRVKQVFCAPGNAGTAEIATNVPLAVDDIPALVHFAQQENIDLAIVAPEDPLCLGAVDALTAAKIRAFGPTRDAARLEGDKAFAKELMHERLVPTADARIFTKYRDARTYVASRDSAVVIKAAGLAKGKGVIVCDDPADGLIALEKIMVDQIFGSAGNTVLVEERLTGIEVSIQALVDGRTIYLLESAQDHKNVGEGDTGPNTGGMGAFSPSHMTDEHLHRQISSEVLVPILDAMNTHGITYKGVLYAGLMLTAGGPKVLEFNCRFGDPEAQVILPRLKNDLVDVCDAVIDGKLDQMTLQWDGRPAACVVLASGGYPGEYRTGMPITGLREAAAVPNVHVFHSGTKTAGHDVVTSGGRVLAVTALGHDLRAAVDTCYRAVDRIHFEGGFCRRDIAAKALTSGENIA